MKKACVAPEYKDYSLRFSNDGINLSMIFDLIFRSSSGESYKFAIVSTARTESNENCPFKVHFELSNYLSQVLAAAVM